MSKKTQAKVNYLNSKKGGWLGNVFRARKIPADQLSDTALPDDFEFDGWQVVNGKFCKTVDEYKAALDKNNTDMNGWNSG